MHEKRKVGVVLIIIIRIFLKKKGKIKIKIKMVLMQLYAVFSRRVLCPHCAVSGSMREFRFCNSSN